MNLFPLPFQNGSISVQSPANGGRVWMAAFCSAPRKNSYIRSISSKRGFRMDLASERADCIFVCTCSSIGKAGETDITHPVTQTSLLQDYVTWSQTLLGPCAVHWSVFYFFLALSLFLITQSRGFPPRAASLPVGPQSGPRHATLNRMFHHTSLSPRTHVPAKSKTWICWTLPVENCHCVKMLTLCFCSELRNMVCWLRWDLSAGLRPIISLY